MAVFPSSYVLEVGLQPSGSFRELLINEDFVQGVWPLAETSPLSLAEDISGNRNHGVYDSAVTRGVTVDLPEGALGITVTGSEEVVIPYTDDLSLPNGSMDIIFLMKTSVNDSELRGIVHKFDGTNGYVVELFNGGIHFALWSGGSNVFTFSRGSGLADSAWHLIHCCYEPEDNRARIFIDGVQASTAVTGTTEPQVVNVDLRICGFRSGFGRFIGSLAFVMVGREGNPALSVPLHAVRSWTTINTDTRGAVEPIRWRNGIAGSGVLDDVASPGQLTFAVDNSASNSGGLVGYYSPGHANCRSGWRIGIPVRLSFTYDSVRYYKFRGHITDIAPTAGVKFERAVSVTCSDWFDLAASTQFSAVESQISQRSDYVARLVIDRCDGRSPAAFGASVGSSTFPYALDAGSGEGETLLTPLTRVTQSERAYCYMVSDVQQGGTLIWIGRGTRQLGTIPGNSVELSDTMQGLEVRSSFDDLVNVVRVIVTPRQVDSAPSVLYRLEAGSQSQSIAPGETVVFEGGYRDPDQEVASVGGTDMIALVANTDYGFRQTDSASGTDLSANLSVTQDLGGTAFRIEFTNTGGIPGFLRLSADTAFQIRGTSIRHYSPITVERRDNESIRRYGQRTVQIELPYESSRNVAESVADYILNVSSQQRPTALSVDLAANASDTLMKQALVRTVGSKVFLTETVTGVSATGFATDLTLGNYINLEEHEFSAGSILRTRWTLGSATSIAAGIFDTSMFDDDFTFGF